MHDVSLGLYQRGVGILKPPRPLPLLQAEGPLCRCFSLCKNGRQWGGEGGKVYRGGGFLAPSSPSGHTCQAARKGLGGARENGIPPHALPQNDPHDALIILSVYHEGKIFSTNPSAFSKEPGRDKRRRGEVVYDRPTNFCPSQCKQAQDGGVGANKRPLEGLVGAT